MREHGLTRKVLESLGERIAIGDFSGQQSLPTEAALSEEYNASRSIMREAVKMLTAKGLISARPKLGLQVRPEHDWNLLDPDVLKWLLQRELSIDLLIEFTEIRMAIEPQAVRLAAQRATQRSRRELLCAIENMAKAENGEGDPLQTDIDLHLATLRASQNRFIAQHASLVETALRFSIRLSNKYKNVSIASVEDHRKIVDGIISGNPDQAAAASTWLLNEAMKFILEAKTRAIESPWDQSIA